MCARSLFIYMMRAFHLYCWLSVLQEPHNKSVDTQCDHSPAWSKRSDKQNNLYSCIFVSVADMAHGIERSPVSYIHDLRCISPKHQIWILYQYLQRSLFINFHTFILPLFFFADHTSTSVFHDIKADPVVKYGSLKNASAARFLTRVITPHSLHRLPVRFRSDHNIWVK